MTGEESIGPRLRRVNNSLAFLFVLGREIEITWPGVKESSSGGVARNWQRTLFSLRIFIPMSGYLLFGFRWVKRERNMSLSVALKLSIFLFLREIATGARSFSNNYGCVLKETAMRDFVVSNARIFIILCITSAMIFLIEHFQK